MSQPETVRKAGRRRPTEQDLQSAVPRSTGARELRVGLFVLVGLVSFLVVLFLMTDPATFRGRYLIHTAVPDAGGLRRGDPVQMRGVNIGRVHRFRMAEEGVLVTLEIEGEWDIPVDSRARLVSSGILGGRTVEVVPGQAAEPARAGALLPGQSVEGVFEVAEQIGVDAEVVLRRIEALLSEPTIEAVHGSARELQSLLTELSSLTRAQSRQITRLTASLARSAESLEQATGAAPEAARAVARADSALAHLNRAGSSLDGASRSLATFLERLERGEGTLGRLSTDEALYNTLHRAAESLLLLTTDIRENPSRYINISIF